MCEVSNDEWPFYWSETFFCGIRADGGLAPTEGGNDDGIVGGPRTPQQIAAQRRLQQTQAQVDEVQRQITLKKKTFLSKITFSFWIRSSILWKPM